jgi:DNA-binding transcriptional MerR regulator
MAGKIEKMYYSMGEVADMLDVTPSLLRFWEKRFDILTPTKNKKGNRLFSPDDVRNLKTIYHLVKERGMTLDGAARQLRARRSDITRDMEIAERLAAIRALLLEVRNELTGGGVIVDSTDIEEVGLKPEGVTEAHPSVKTDGNRRCEREQRPLADSAELRGGRQAERSNESAEFSSHIGLKPDEVEPEPEVRLVLEQTLF